MNKRTKIAITLSCVGLLAGLSACASSEPRDTIQGWVVKDIEQYYQVDVALSEPQKITYSAGAEEEALREHGAQKVIVYKTTAFQFAYEDIVDGWISVVWVKENTSFGANYARSDLEISSVNYSRFYA